MVGCEGISERIDGIEAGDLRSEGCIYEPCSDISTNWIYAEVNSYV